MVMSSAFSRTLRSPAADRNGTRYIVARENQSGVRGLTSLSDRERQVVAYLAVGQSTKETAYALGISDITVRVLIAHAAAKLGVRSRRALLDHVEIRRLRPGATDAPASAPKRPKPIGSVLSPVGLCRAGVHGVPNLGRCRSHH
jgi:DNA-binding CsgD family transcriptional regulator